jgi:hypothetical protein
MVSKPITTRHLSGRSVRVLASGLAFVFRASRMTIRERVGGKSCGGLGGESGGLVNHETWQRSRSARGVEPSSRPAGWWLFPSDDVREGSPRRAAERQVTRRVSHKVMLTRLESVLVRS